jgi:hypothetical protein
VNEQHDGKFLNAARTINVQEIHERNNLYGIARSILNVSLDIDVVN